MRNSRFCFRLAASVGFVMLATPGAALAQARGTVRGVVYDSLARHPLAGAMVQLLLSPAADTSYVATTDSSGAFQIDSVKPGRYVVGFFHTALEDLGVSSPTRTLDVTAGGSSVMTLWIPDAAGVIQSICGAAGLRADSTALLLGHVRDAESGEPIVGSTVVVVWYELIIDHGVRRQRRQVPVKTNALGRYAICRLPIDRGLSARAELGADATGFIDITPAAGAVELVNFSIARADVAAPSSPIVTDGMHRGSARLTGSVKNRTGRAIAGAQVRVLETAATTTTADNGTFALGALPAGTQSVEVRSIGYAPKRAAVALSTRTPGVVELVMSERVAELDAVTVYGQKNEQRSGALREFLERRKGGFGTFVTQADIEKQQPLTFCDVLRRMAGVVVSVGGGGNNTLGRCVIRMRGPDALVGECTPQFFLDGARITGGAGDIEGAVRPEEIAGVEVYRGAATTPSQFAGGCGAVVVWSGAMRR